MVALRRFGRHNPTSPTDTGPMDYDDDSSPISYEPLPVHIPKMVANVEPAPTKFWCGEHGGLEPRSSFCGGSDRTRLDASTSKLLIFSKRCGILPRDRRLQQDLL